MYKKILLIVLLTTTLFSKQSIYDPYYEVGNKIAEGVSLSLVYGMSVADPKLTYETTTKNDTFTLEPNTWPIIEVSTKIYSKVIGNINIEYYLFLEENSGYVIGTVKAIKVDRNPKNTLTIMNNKMFIEDEEGTKQVQLVNGQLQYVE